MYITVLLYTIILTLLGHNLTNVSVGGPETDTYCIINV